MTPLEAQLLARIAAGGPVSIAAYMSDCLFDPDHGYYRTRDPLGAAGDFTTAPEISQMFGECVGLALAQNWIDQGRPAPFVLAELGPGRGTLMADILRATAKVPGFHAGLTVHLVETSSVLRDRQRGVLRDGAATWHDGLQTLPPQPLFLVANEFFDALPIRQFVRDGGRWRERVVGMREGRLALGLADPAEIPGLDHRLADTRDGDLVETCGPAMAIAGELGRRIGTAGGAAIIIDYGDWRAQGDTLQAVKDHRPVPPLDMPGAADLTAHVDFEALALAALPAAHTRLTPQGVLLERLGIAQRATMLSKSLSGDPLRSHLAAYRRLTHPTEMGSLFKAIALYPDDMPQPPGFEP